MKTTRIVLVLVLITALLAACSGNNAQSDNSDENSTPLPSPDADNIPRANLLYVNEQFGFTLEFPASWKGKYGIETVVFNSKTDWSVEIFHNSSREEMGHGWLFNIGCTPGEDYTEEAPPVMSGWCPILAQTGGRTYYANTPSGVEYNQDSESESAVEYKEMANEIEQVMKSFKLMPAD